MPDRFCGTSSIMMQKKNPDSLEYVRGAVADAMGGLVASFAVQKAASGDPTMDLRYMDDALFRSFDMAIRNLGWFIELMPALEVKEGADEGDGRGALGAGDGRGGCIGQGEGGCRGGRRTR